MSSKKGSNKIIYYAIGGLVAFIILIIVVATAIKKPNTSQSRIASTRYEPQNFDNTRVSQLQQTVLAQQQQIEDLKKSVDQLQASNQQRAKELAHNINANFNSLNNNIENLNGRLTLIEQARYATTVQVVRPSDRVQAVPAGELPTATATEVTDKASLNLGTLTVIGTVGNRIWINTGGKEESVTVGDTIRGANNQSYIIRQINAQTGEILVSTK